ncbi:MAG: DEAD/DEAH box helicase [Promethearchaeota archaeon]
MTFPLKKFFTVLDRNRQNKKELLFNINLFYLKSFKEKSFTFAYVNEPFFRGTVTFGLDIRNKIRPLSFNKIDKDGTIIPVNPRLLKKFLLSNENKFVAFPSQTISEELTPIKEMLKNFQFDKNRIINLTFCDSCLDKQKFTILREGFQIKSLKNQIVCTDCAYEIILRQAKVSGLFPDGKVSPKLKNFFQHLILKFKDIKKVVSAFKADFNPVRSKEITIYDIERSPTISKKYLNYSIKDLEINPSFKQVLQNLKISTLLPIQAISIENGLLSEENDQLIMAPTSAGKTLVGELAGITKLLEDKSQKLLYLVPIVALANIRTEVFKKKYKPLNLKILKRVGESLFEKKDEDNLEDLINADIIIATYEAIDFILRSGNKEKIGNFGTIVIDEIQTLIDPDRGFLLDGFIARLKSLFNDAQFLYLSATVGEPQVLANKLNSVLIRYNNRPVPIERHLLLCLNENIKQKYIAKLVKNSFSKQSIYGFKGQSIIFTNTRKKCEALAVSLQNKGVNMRAYHSGLTNEERKVIESDFQSQKITGVVATAALAAGVDLPARQVIFESLAMGINWLSVAEFEQMLGRAGRLKKHELGLAYVLVEPGKIYSPKMRDTEENIAIKLLSGKIKDFELPANEDKSLTELLASISIYREGVNREKLFEYYGYLINNYFELNIFLNRLNSLKLIRVKENFLYKVTRIGQAIAKSFLTVEQCIEIIEMLKNNQKSIIEIALDLKSLKNVYLSKKIVSDLAKNVSMKYFSNNLFSASVLSLMNADYVRKRKSFSQGFIDFIMNLTNDIFNCNCKDNPYCDCGRLNLEKLILKLRIENNLSIKVISSFLEENYNIIIYKGDIIDYLQNLIYSLESLKNIAEGLVNLNKNYIEEVLEIPIIIERIKY